MGMVVYRLISRIAVHAYDAGSIEMLARLFEEALRAVTQHCLKAPLSHCYTPSDFPLVTRKSPSLLDQSLLDTLLSGDGDIEDLVPLTPLQQGLVFEVCSLAWMCLIRITRSLL